MKQLPSEELALMVALAFFCLLLVAASIIDFLT